MQFVEIEKYRPILRALSTNQKIIVRVVKAKDDWVTFKVGNFQIEAPISGIDVELKDGMYLQIEVITGAVTVV